MRFRGAWFMGAMVYVVFAPIAFSRFSAGRYNHLELPSQDQDWGLRNPFQISSPYSIFLSTLSGLRKTTQRKRTAMGMDLTDYLWSKAHEKHRAMMLQRMMKNGKR